MGAYDPAAWSDFAVAIAGAAAGLTGLLFVAVSLNLQRILAYPQLPGLAAQTLMLFVAPLVDAIFLLVPAQPVRALAYEILVTGVVLGAALVRLSFFRSLGEQERFLARLVARVVPSAGTLLLSVAACVSLLQRAGGGLLWLVALVLLCLVSALENAWVLLVEIQR